MKKNITINLCGRLFQIDEDAYELLRQYIESLHSSFGKEEGGNEIVDDIEARIAELFDELHQQKIEAITIEHVKDIITRIGEPEQLTDSDEKNSGGDEGHKYDSFQSAAQGIFDNIRTRTAGKRLYRNPNDKMVAGVLSGLATYTGTDPVIWRLLAVIFTFFYGIGLILYIALAIILPEAKAPEQQLQMQGKDITPQNIADVVVEDRKEQPNSSSNLLKTLFSILLKITIAFAIGIAIIIGICLVLCLYIYDNRADLRLGISHLKRAAIQHRIHGADGTLPRKAIGSDCFCHFPVYPAARAHIRHRPHGTFAHRKD
ncbi:MAG: PspC domain-containing protein [Prevotella sp.]|nr:PspC domain-containing protein [Prevotella sp.]MBP3839316.1 PspC domain-containing protein [Prevotella sp.]